MSPIKLHLQNIGVAILSTNRPECTKRILDSIENNTSMNSWSIFVLDDSSTEYKDRMRQICHRPWVNFIDTGNMIGIAKNTNRAISCIKDYDYMMILNNDVEILKENWAFFYPISMIKTGIHHFCFQQEGLWGAGTKKRPQRVWEKGGVSIKTILNFPQGAILVYDQLTLQTVGYFDANLFKGYGKSHWDWSFRVSDSGIQVEGIHDVCGSNEYFKVHDELSATPELKRIEDYHRNTKLYNDMRSQPQKRIKIDYV